MCSRVVLNMKKTLDRCALAIGCCIVSIAGALPANSQTMPAKAEITYEGTYSARVWRKSRQSQRVDLGKILSGMTAEQGQRYEGAITIKLRIDGAAAYAEISGTGGMSPATLTGLVRNGQCRLTDKGATYVYEGACSPEGFVGTIMSSPNNRMNSDGKFQTATTSFVDVAMRERETAAAKAVKDAQDAERRKVIDAEKALLKKQCDAGKASACVKMDTLE